MSYLFNDQVQFKGNAVDAFNRLRVSNPFTLFDQQSRYKINGKSDFLTATGGTYTHNPNDSAISHTVSGTTGSIVIQQSKRVFSYQPGKSLLVFKTFAFAPPRTGLRQRTGYFGTENGIYLEHDGTDLYFVIRSFVTGSVQERRIKQSDWNTDKFDGQGASGNLLDVTKANILWMDIEWLGVGNVRCGFVVDGRPILAHVFENTNQFPTTYMTTACLPLRTEIENVQGATGSSTMKTICATVISEGGYEASSTLYHAGTDTTPITLTAAGTYYQVASVRMKSNRIDSIILPANISAAVIPKNVSDTSILRWDLRLNAPLTGASWTAHTSSTSVEISKTPVVVGGGTSIRSGFMTVGSAIDLAGFKEFNYQLGRSIGGTSDTLTLCVSPYTSGVDLVGELGWYEIV